MLKDSNDYKATDDHDDAHLQPGLNFQLRGINFVKKDNLLYFIDPTERIEKLCIPSAL
jgi:hypothetical protein